MGTYLCLLFVSVIGVSEAKEPSCPTAGWQASLTQKLRYTTLGTSLLAIASDGLVEYYYQKYKSAEFPDECKKYRERTQLCEKVRDIAIWTTGLSLIGSIISEKLTHKSESYGFLDKLKFEFSGKKVGVRICYEI